MIKKIITLSLVTSSMMFASETQLGTVNVESTVLTEVSQNAQVSADLADALSTSVPSIDISRRSGIANDVLIRGQKRDNISIDIDGTKVQGACVNRMDPPISHIITNQINDIEVIEGPYDVENFGTLSGGVKIKTKQPTKELKSEINLGYGAWNYIKYGATVSGGNDLIRVLVSASSESSDQYQDGNGDTIAEQIDNYIVANPTAAGTAFQSAYKDMPSYEKQSVMTKAFVTVTDNQELRLSYTANKSDNVLYGNSKMDAIYDDSNIYSVEYNVNNLSDAYKNLNIQYYASDVDHPMGTDYRWSSDATNPANSGLPNVMTNWLTTDMKGIKLKNSFEIGSYNLLVGLDSSERSWDGSYFKNGTSFMGRKSIDDATTTNSAIFTKVKTTLGSLDLTAGLRYDSTEITHATLQSNDYSSFGLNLLSTYNLNEASKVFFGFGQASRVPDARELYFTGMMTNLTGTPDLDQTTNTEIDLGYELHADTFSLKVKAFYSMLSDYIYFNKNNTTVIMGKTVSLNSFENIDATIYGAELSTSYYATDDLSIDMAATYKVGKKDEALTGQTNTNLGDIAPLRANLAVNYEYMKDSLASMTLRASDTWDTIDSDNGEQELASWSVIDMKVKHTFNKTFDFTLGVNNLLDETYAQSNTYSDLILITAGGTSDVMLMNEPGRYIYTNLNVKF